MATLPPPAPTSWERPITVVLVDDHPMVREGTQTLLARTPGIRVAGVASDGASALKLIRAHDPDVLLLDMHLPDINGLEVARRALDITPHLCIIVLTGYNAAGYLATMRQIGVRGYLEKTATGEQIVAAIRAVVSNEHFPGGDALRGWNEASLERLTAREQEVLELMVAGHRNMEIAEKLVVSVKTVEFHVRNIFEKLGVRSRAEVVRKAIEEGLCTLDRP